MQGAEDGAIEGRWGIRSIDGVSPADSAQNRTDVLRILLPTFLGFLLFGGLAVIFAVTTGPAPEGIDAGTALALLLVALVVFVPMIWLSCVRLPLWTLHVIAVSADILIIVLAFALGPEFSPFAAALCFVCLGILGFLVSTRRAAVLHLLPIFVGYGLVVSLQDGNPEPFSRWLLVVGVAIVSAFSVSGLVERGRRLAQAERAASTAEREALAAAELAQRELAELNRTLEERVVEQVDELGRLGELRRFLAKPVADALLSGDAESLLQPHRRQIAVFFCDLRGFTSFASGAQPEEVVEVLDDYYAAVGATLRRFEATVGAFAGDGIMAFLNDPIRCDDPAARAVSMAVDLRRPLGEVTSVWRRRGYELGYGVGIAYGYATLGMIGVEGRSDYTALGAVVNLASRLCDEARDGEILIDQRTRDELHPGVPVDQREVLVKGLREPLTAYLVLTEG